MFASELPRQPYTSDYVDHNPGFFVIMLPDVDTAKSWWVASNLSYVGFRRS